MLIDVHPTSLLVRRSLQALGGVLCLVAVGCVGVAESGPANGDLGSAEAELEVASEGWRAHVGSSEVDVRVRAAEVIPVEPGDDGIGVLEHLATADPDARVRERAVLSYGSVRGKEAIPFLRDVALSRDEERVTNAAFAELGRVRAEAGEPPRGFLRVELPPAFSVGEDFDLGVTLGSTEDVTEARLRVRLPASFVPVSGRAPEWRGSLLANRPETLVIRVRAGEPIERAGLRASLYLAYPEALDTEELRESYRVWTDAEGGHFAEAKVVATAVEMVRSEP